MKLSELRRIVREEIKAVYELTQQEKAANIKASQADILAKTIALKGAQDKLKKTQSQQVDQT
jgi:hypothetical protein